MNKCPCFECGGVTITRYYSDKVTRICDLCNWEGYKVKLPASRKSMQYTQQ